MVRLRQLDPSDRVQRFTADFLSQDECIRSTPRGPERTALAAQRDQTLNRIQLRGPQGLDRATRPQAQPIVQEIVRLRRNARPIQRQLSRHEASLNQTQGAMPFHVTHIGRLDTRDATVRTSGRLADISPAPPWPTLLGAAPEQPATGQQPRQSRGRRR